MPPRGINHLGYFGLRNFECIDPANPDAVLVNVEHDARGIVLRLVEEAHQNFDHKTHWGVVVIEQEYLVE